MRKLFFVFVILSSQWIHAQTTRQPMDLADSLKSFYSAPAYQSTQNNLRAIDLDFASRDLVLQPRLELDGSRTFDSREVLGGTAGRDRMDTLRLSLIKTFATGTEIRLVPSLEQGLYDDQTPNEQTTFDWQISLTQSLWKDSFGRSTRLRWDREDYEKRRQMAAALNAQGQLIEDFESLYWDWAFAIRASELRDKNVKRGEEILKWVRNRFNRSAAESTDLLQAQALLTSRQLELSAVRQNLTQVLSRAERYIPNLDWQPNPDQLSVRRDINALTAQWKWDKLDRASSLELIEAKNAALVSKISAEEAREAIRPEFNLQLAYGKNAIDPERSEAYRNALDENHEYSSVGFVFRSGLDVMEERRRVNSARASQQSAEQRYQSLEAEDRVAWEQLTRDIAELQTRIETSEELVKLQTRKANAERERYRMGRTTAFQAITYEQDVSVAEINLLALYTELRKTEARARQFAR